MLSSAAAMLVQDRAYLGESEHTFDELAAVDFAGCDLKRDNMSLKAISTCITLALRSQHTAASLRSLIGIPIVLVIFAESFCRVLRQLICASRIFAFLRSESVS